MRRTKIVIYSGFRKIELFLKRFYLLTTASMLAVFFIAIMTSPTAKQAQYFMRVLEKNQAQNMQIFTALNQTVANLDTTVRFIHMQTFAYQNQTKAAWDIMHENNKKLNSEIAKLHARQSFYSQIIVENSKRIDQLIRDSKGIDSTKKNNPHDPPAPERQVILREREWIRN